MPTIQVKSHKRKGRIVKAHSRKGSTAYLVKKNEFHLPKKDAKKPLAKGEALQNIKENDTDGGLPPMKSNIGTLRRSIKAADGFWGKDKFSKSHAESGSKKVKSHARKKSDSKALKGTSMVNASMKVHGVKVISKPKSKNTISKSEKELIKASNGFGSKTSSVSEGRSRYGN